jgi:hypothetical protein
MEMSDNKEKYRKITVRTTDGSNLTGSVFLGESERVSELFTQSDNPFIVMVDYEHRAGSGEAIFINKNQVVWAVPEE